MREHCRMLEISKAKNMFHVQCIAPLSLVFENNCFHKGCADVQPGANTAYLFTLMLIGETARKGFGSGPGQPTNAPGILQEILIKVAEQFPFVFTCGTARTV